VPLFGTREAVGLISREVCERAYRMSGCCATNSASSKQIATPMYRRSGFQRHNVMRAARRASPVKMAPRKLMQRWSAAPTCGKYPVRILVELPSNDWIVVVFLSLLRRVLKYDAPFQSLPPRHSRSPYVSQTPYNVCPRTEALIGPDSTSEDLSIRTP